MPETKPSDPDATSSEESEASTASAAHTPASSAPVPEPQAVKRQMFQHWLQSVRPAPRSPVPRAAPAPSPSPLPAPPVTSSDHTQLSRRAPADLLREARELPSYAPPAPSGPPSARATPVAPAMPAGSRDEAWAAIADERTAVFAPPPELLASVRAAAAAAGITLGSPAEVSPSAPNIQVGYDAAQVDPSSDVAPQVSEHEVTKVAPTPSDTGAAESVASLASVDSAAGDEAEFRPRGRRWLWILALLAVAGFMAWALATDSGRLHGFGVRSHMPSSH
jgi:hypothetical protein